MAKFSDILHLPKDRNGSIDHSVGTLDEWQAKQARGEKLALVLDTYTGLYRLVTPKQLIEFIEGGELEVMEQKYADGELWTA